MPQRLSGSGPCMYIVLLSGVNVGWWKPGGKLRRLGLPNCDSDSFCRLAIYVLQPFLSFRLKYNFKPSRDSQGCSSSAAVEIACNGVGLVKSALALSLVRKKMSKLSPRPPGFPGSLLVAK